MPQVSQFEWNCREPDRSLHVWLSNGGESMRQIFYLSALVLAGCVSSGVHPLRPLEIPTAPYIGAPTTALTGTLMYESGCLLFRDERNRHRLVPVWPEGSIFNGTSVIFHEPGKSDQRIGVGE